MPKVVTETYECDQCEKEHTPYAPDTVLFYTLDGCVTIGTAGYPLTPLPGERHFNLYFCSKECALRWWAGLIGYNMEAK